MKVVLLDMLWQVLPKYIILYNYEKLQFQLLSKFKYFYIPSVFFAHVVPV